MSYIDSDSPNQEKSSLTHDLEKVTNDDVSSTDRQIAQTENLNRSLRGRTINMITIAGVIGSGLYLGTGKMLATGGPLSMLLAYVVIGLIVFFMMLSLGEMSVQYPVSGSFTTYAKRFGSDSLGFAILINYWFNDACSVAGDLTALQLIFEYWTDFHWYVISIIFWVFLLFLNVIHVRVYGETEYWLALLKVVTIFIFFIISIVANVGKNPEHEYIGFKWWSYGDAPFVNGIAGFSSLFVSAAFALGGLESVSLTAGETKNPTRIIPKTIKATFWRIAIFYVFTAFFIGMNIPYDYPNLNTKTVATSPFTIVFQMVGAKGAGSFMNAVIMTSLLSAGNHALFAGSRLAFNLSTQGYIPKIFTKLNRFGIPYVAVIFTWFCGGLCFASSFVGAGTLWNWIQSIVGLSNLISWWLIGVVSLRFRRGLEKQGRTHELLMKNWSYPYGPWFVVIFGGFIILVQGWSTLVPFQTADFFQSYLELGIFPLCFIFWWLIVKRGKDKFIRAADMDFDTDRYYVTPEEQEENDYADSLKGWKKFRYGFVESFL
ncbi:amino acid permease/ SLC12A domain-containing protein [Scheffersomyces coipomensis]|uniref:amino acid permease/ SLC12A domain-containing protein n=1 Tax=Scheffersomyces coipomensis TaxID=1788519 RepID=UPI00315CCE08